MNNLSLLPLGITLLMAPASAAPCAKATLASYIALGSSGCLLGNLLVSDFAYHRNADGGAAEITADQIDVTPLIVPGNYALQFAAPWSVEGGQSQASKITYQVHAQATSIQVQQLSLDGNGFEAGMFGNVIVNETFASPAGNTGNLEVFLKCTEVCRSHTSANVSITPTGALVIVDKVTLKSKLGHAALASFTDWLVVCPQCV